MSLGKKDIVDVISSKALLNKSESYLLLNKFLSLLKINKKKNIKFPNFGSFISHKTPERIGRNPKTKKEFIIAKRTKLIFKPSNFVRNKIN